MSVTSSFDQPPLRDFVDRHIGPDTDAQAKMLAVVGYGSLEELVAAAVPPSIKDEAGRRSVLPPAATEDQVLSELRALAGRNVVTTSMIGLGY